MTLAEEQHEIVTNWVRLGQPSSPPPSGPHAPSAPAQSAKRAECTVSASYSSAYVDYDVYFHSNQPDQTVTVTDAYGHSDTWHTDASGYADIYFKSGGYTAGREVVARAGRARCSTTL
jgi:hypothetical protein